MQDLAYHFPTVSRIFKKWVVKLDTRLKPLLFWPEFDDLRRTVPECFRAKFKDKVAVIIDCFEVFISFISQAWGGRVSDKYLTEHCGILTKLLPGDIVLADSGCDITDSGPAFTKGKAQLTALELEKTRSITNVRIHVERVIGIVRQKYTIPYCENSCALCNLCDSVVLFD